MDNTEQFRKNFIWNTLGTGINAFNSLFFLIAVTRINGVSTAGIFTIAFSTACIIYVLGIYSGRIYQVTEQDTMISDKDYFISRIITIVLMMITVICFVFFKKYELFKSIIFILLTLYKALEAFSDVLYGILQKNNKLDIVGKSLFIKSVLGIIFFVVFDIFTKNIILSILVLIIINGIIILFYDLKNNRNFLNFNIKVKKDSIIKIFKSGFYTFAISFLGIYILNAPKYAIDSFLEDNYQTVFGIIVMPATVVGLVAQFLIHPFLNKIVELYKNKEMKEIQKLGFKLVLVIAVFGIVSSILAYIIGTQILGIIYGLDLNLYKLKLFIIIIAATLYTIGIVYSSILTSIRETCSQFIIYVMISIFALLVSSYATFKAQLDGAILSYLLIMTVHFFIYTIYGNIKIIKKEN